MIRDSAVPGCNSRSSPSAFRTARMVDREQHPGERKIVRRFRVPLKTDEVTRAYFPEMAKVEDGSIKNDLIKIADGPLEAAMRAMERVAPVSPRWNPMLRTTIFLRSWPAAMRTHRIWHDGYRWIR